MITSSYGYPVFCQYYLDSDCISNVHCLLYYHNQFTKFPLDEESESEDTSYETRYIVMFVLHTSPQYSPRFYRKSPGMITCLIKVAFLISCNSASLTKHKYNQLVIFCWWQLVQSCNNSVGAPATVCTCLLDPFSQLQEPVGDL